MGNEYERFGQKYVHRLIAAEMVGRDLLPGEQIHHINGDRRDNRPENLEVVSAHEHRQRHLVPECMHGHDLTNPANVYLRPDTGARQCRACNTRRSSERAAKRKAERHARRHGV
jgi:hypothetical protein